MLIGYFFLLLSSAFNLTKSYCSKRVSSKVETMADTVDMTVVRNGLCAVIGAFIIALGNGCDFRLPSEGIIICLVAGLAVGVNYIVWVLSLKSGVYLMASAVTSASFIVASLCGILFFHENITWSKGAASLLILIAILFMVKYQNQSYEKINFKYAVLLVLVFLTAGVSSVTQKWFTRTLPETSGHIYTFYSMLISFVILFVVSLTMGKKRPVHDRAVNINKILAVIVIMAICFYATTYFQTEASSRLEAVVMYPVFNGIQLAAGSIMAWLCFKEKPNKNSIIGVILVFSAVMLAGL